jgi:P27 family predicted phage terminase small subunit
MSKPRKTPQPPAYLAEPTRRWWRGLAAEFAFEAQDFRLLEIAALSWDRLQQAREVIAREGITLATTKGVVPHPATKIENDSMIRFMRALRELALDVEPPGAPRPPQLKGYRNAS